MKTFTCLVAALSRLCGIAAALMVLTSVLVVCQMVFMRYVLNSATNWQTEFVTYILIASTFVGSPYVLLTRGHVNVDLLPLYVSHRWRVVLALLASSVSLAFCLIITWYGYQLWLESWDKAWLSDSMWGVRMWIPYSAMPIGFAVLSLQYVADILSLIAGHDMPFGINPQHGLREE